MTLTLNLRDVREEHRSLVGGKTWHLARLAGQGFRVSDGLAVTTEAYRQYLSRTGLGDRLRMILGRKDFEAMRWEEIWDTSLRVRNLFLRTPLPANLEAELSSDITISLSDVPAAVRSSAPGEDDAAHSFAGLHASYLNVLGLAGILDHVRRVWASLWSDAALLYRREMGLDVEASAMAVLVQEFVPGESSGVAFSRSPDARDRVVIEAVHGLNQGLVDGTVTPDRWVLDRESGEVVSFDPAERQQSVVPLAEGIRLEPLDGDRRSRPALVRQELARVRDLALRAEAILGSPQDVEWTLRGGELYLLQSRPITTGGARRETSGEGAVDDRRPWYLSLRRNYENLQALRRRVEGEFLPAMDARARGLASTQLSALTDAELAREIEARAEIYVEWRDVYWRDFIPLAHGARLFGEFYNETVRPEDPHEFVTLLVGPGLQSVRRNDRLEEVAAALRRDPTLPERHDPEFERIVRAFLDEFGACAWEEELCLDGRSAVLRIARELADAPPRGAAGAAASRGKAEAFLAGVDPERRPFAESLLDLARASYRLRDDDNLHLGAIRARWMEAVEEGRRRLRRCGVDVDRMGADSIPATLRGEIPGSGDERPLPREKDSPGGRSERVRVRQIVGQPAGPGLAQGVARVVAAGPDLLSFQAGEVLVCDAVEPNMTFVVPLATAIVERRGGMLIHGAIIAREYGIPCVTGVPEASRLIHTGDWVTVDGFLGIVVVDSQPPARSGS